MLFTKKPVTIEAVQITDSTFDAPHPNPEHITGVTYDPTARCVRIKTLEGEMVGNIGDWIIKGVKGELYPCKPDIFEATYRVASPAVFDGGPAFPAFTDKLCIDTKANAINCVTYGGMSLRDWFAGKALPAVLARVFSQDDKHGLNDRFGIASKMAYEAADAMLTTPGDHK